MSTVTLLSTSIPDLLPMTSRSEGLHVSDIIHHAFTSNPLIPGYYKPSNDRDSTRSELGNALEDAIALRLHQNNPTDYLLPGELSCDGLHGTPDIYRVSFEAVQEIKLTWESIKRINDAGVVVDPWSIENGTVLPANSSPLSGSYARRWWQVKSYCYMMGVTRGLLTVVYIMGDYKHKRVFAPTWMGEFTEDELTDHWRMMLSTGERMLKDGWTREALNH